MNEDIVISQPIVTGPADTVVVTVAAAVTVVPVPATKPCPFCGSSNVYWNPSNRLMFTLAHKEGCFLYRLTSFKIGEDKHSAWNIRNE